MRVLTGLEELTAKEYFDEAADVALDSKCLRAPCGSVIVKDDEVIGYGYNAPPDDKKLAQCRKDYLPDDFKSDKTCCVHAEQNAIIDALARNAQKLPGSRIYFIRLDAETKEQQLAGEPYCTICSKMSQRVEIAEFALLREEGVCVWDSDEYNQKSFAYR